MNRPGVRALALTVVLGLVSQADAATIILNDIGGAASGTAAGDAFREAADIWESLLFDDVTIRVDVGFSTLGGGTLGSTSSSQVVAGYSGVRGALLGDSQSAADASSSGSLFGGGSLVFFTNDAGGAVIVDGDGSANNSFLGVNRANAKALGLLVDDGSTADGSIQFNDTGFTFDFDRGDGIAGGSFDFVGVALHELGHLLGFVSGVDAVDVTTGAGPSAGVDLNPFAVFSVLDLFRYTGGVTSIPGGFYDFTTGDLGPQAFTVDGGATVGPTFETGRFNGSGQQASHWSDGLGIGLMDPTLAPGELATISANDLLAFDVIGWNLSPLAAVPEPSTFALFGLGLVGFGVYSRRRRRKTNAPTA